MTDKEPEIPEGVLDGIKDIAEGNTAEYEELQELIKSDQNEE